MRNFGFCLRLRLAAGSGLIPLALSPTESMTLRTAALTTNNSLI